MLAVVPLHQLWHSLPDLPVRKDAPRARTWPGNRCRARDWTPLYAVPPGVSLATYTSDRAKANVLSQDRIDELIGALSLRHPLEHRPVFLLNQARYELVDELDIELFSDLT